MAKLSVSNIRKTAYFLGRNGIAGTVAEVRSRLLPSPYENYHYEAPSMEEEEEQRQWYANHCREGIPTFSVLVPLYRSNPVYLRRMLDSVREQTYSGWEIVLADGTEDGSVENLVRTYLKEYPELATRREKEADADLTGDEPPQIYYVHCTGSHGISSNTNSALQKACGSYVAFLDHDDELTKDALYCMAQEILKEEKWPDLLYSDEDKMDESGKLYYDPNFKPDFDLDYLLGNNYICHLTVARRNVARENRFREAFDGAQDHDFLLRVAARENLSAVHIPKVLYHWRCFTGSTSENPGSKQYAYRAGHRAVEEAVKNMKLVARVSDSAHVGFYQLHYENGFFEKRPEIGAVGGRIRKGTTTIGGAMQADGTVEFMNLHYRVGGYMNRALTNRQVVAVDVRCLYLRKELWGLFETVTGVPYAEMPRVRGEDAKFDWTVLPKDADYREISLALSEAIHAAGYKILYTPTKETKWKK